MPIVGISVMICMNRQKAKKIANNILPVLQACAIRIQRENSYARASSRLATKNEGDGKVGKMMVREGK